MSKSKEAVQREDAEYCQQNGTLKFNYEEWLSAMEKETHGVKHYRWEAFWGTHTYNDPHTLMLHCIFMMQEHIMFKLANSEFDVNSIAFIRKGLHIALAEADLQFWRMSKKN